MEEEVAQYLRLCTGKLSPYSRVANNLQKHAMRMLSYEDPHWEFTHPNLWCKLGSLHQRVTTRRLETRNCLQQAALLSSKTSQFTRMQPEETVSVTFIFTAAFSGFL